jgi:hypothetical protein
MLFGEVDIFILAQQIFAFGMNIRIVEKDGVIDAGRECSRTFFCPPGGVRTGRS